MANEVHGHEVLEHLLASPGATLAELRSWAVAAHGADASYHTCSRAGMSFDELLSFLTERGKVSLQEGGVHAHAERMCSHEHPHNHGEHPHA